MDNQESIDLLKEIIALLSIQVKRGVSQSSLVKELSDAGLQPKRIAELMGTTSNTVRVALHSIRKNKKRK